MFFVSIVLAAAAVTVPSAGKDGAHALAQPGRDPALLHRGAERVIETKEREQERALRNLLALGGGDRELAEVTGRLANLLRSRGLTNAVRAAEEAETDPGRAERDRAAAQVARSEAITLYRELLRKYPRAPRLDEALFFLADVLQDSAKDDEAVAAARELTRRFPGSQWAPASHVFIGEHLFDKGRVAQALVEYRAAAENETDEVYPYALYKAAWCRFNQNAFGEAMNLLQKVVAVSLGGNAADGTPQANANRVQLAREARRDYVIVYARVGAPEKARAEFREKFGAPAGQKMLEQYAKLLFDQGRDPEAQLVHRQLLELHGNRTSAALDQTRLLMIAARGGKRKDLLREANALVETFQRVKKASAADPEDAEPLAEAEQHAEETLRNLAVQLHNEAKKTHLDDTYAATKALYADYLALFPDAPDAYDLRFFDAELLYGLDEKAAAAALYEQVVRQDLAAMKSGKKAGRWLQRAAWGAVVARAEVAGEEKPAQAHNAQRRLNAQEELLASACRLFLEALPDGARSVEVAFKLGRLEYLSGNLDAARQHLSWIATVHPEHELAEYAANLVLDIANLRQDYAVVHQSALRFLEDKRLTAHGNLQTDLKRVEEQSAYAMADAVSGDEQKAHALLAFVETHPRGVLADKAIFGAAAALSRAGQVEAALAARSRLWKEFPGSSLVARALLASSADHAAIGDFGEAATLLERYFAGYKREDEAQRALKAHRRATAPPPERSYDEAKARTALHDAAVLREARGELAKAFQDRQAALQEWPHVPDRAEQVLALNLLRAKLGEPARAARELVALARASHQNATLQLDALREAARLFTGLRESGNATAAWRDLESAYHAASRLQAALPPQASSAAAEAHLALGAQTFEEFKRQRIEPPLARTLNRKVALLQQVKKRAEETVAMRQAEPAVCALAQLGEAQMLLAQAIAESPAPPRLTAQERKLYRDALHEKAAPLLDEARATLSGADAKARELGVTGGCPAQTTALLEKLGVKPSARPELTMVRLPLAGTPPLVTSDGQPVEPGPAGSSTGTAPVSKLNGTATTAPPAQLESTKRRAR
ncbi:MAG TPA: tetratricopeptide repeat protein [Myxococcales bacterium]|nr:tetratricopeptide repeat protein [Myxococcales bacterium]